jgi:hypothetical protein
MNPYLNSLNGFGGGFIAFWPSQGGIEEAQEEGGPSDRIIGHDEEIMTVIISFLMMRRDQ